MGRGPILPPWVTAPGDTNRSDTTLVTPLLNVAAAAKVAMYVVVKWRQMRRRPLMSALTCVIKHERQRHRTEWPRRTSGSVIATWLTTVGRRLGSSGCEIAYKPPPHFLPSDCEAYARYCGRDSVCPSVKRMHCDKTKAPSEKSTIMTNRKLSNEPKMNSVSS